MTPKVLVVAVKLYRKINFTRMITKNQSAIKEALGKSESWCDVGKKIKAGGGALVFVWWVRVSKDGPVKSRPW